ncbi:DeoR family transcriptional regulator [Cohnella sp. CFH 77786]|uniref:DeoR/GlpR family DNA-binding transcription regulator n=1 Tax=Cohnella sp. CFH 77786 TaxID=2662265 RepID=UPI001C60A39C|nr:DeoR/GlpR family DNA-binding transcription regulator [Cohnella sp. CFH 77786]MBW5447211.1 DeoR family transcriptional regulator [Cohnella sp. CFH 77786]
MNPLRRYELIMEMLLAANQVTVAELSERLEVTGKTIREDLAKLEEKGLLQRVHGGAVLAQADQLGILSTKNPVSRHAAEKAEVARLAVSLIEPNDIVALDGGTTTQEIARHLPNQPLTVVTNDVIIISELARKDQVRLVVPGGYRVRNMLTGTEAAQYIRRLNIRKAFLTATGVHPEYGYTIYTGEFHDIKRAWIDTAQSSYVVADHHKFGQGALFTFAKLTEVEAILTDSGISPETEALYRGAGVRLLINREKE